MSNIQNEINRLSKQFHNETVKHRRHIHQWPELSYKELSTSEYVRNLLDEIGIDKIKTVAGTGILAHLKGKREGSAKIILRAELDALPINELSRLPFSSKNKGVMHACGHDSHMAMLLSSAKVLYELRDSFGGDVYFLFQPGEELAPGGASLIMKEGILQEINPDAIIAQHVLPELKSGTCGFRAGKYMASSDEIYIDILGKGGHAALPGSSTDQITLASSLICKLKSAVSNLKDDVPLVLGIGKFIADGATNVIPDKVHIEGTLRTFDETLRKEVHKIIEKTCVEAEIENVSVSLEIRKGYPVLVNNEDLVATAIRVAKKVNGDSSIQMLDLRMSSEDFAFYSEQFPVLFYRLGTLAPGAEIKNLHTPVFDISEAAMETGVRTMVSIAIELLDTLS